MWVPVKGKRVFWLCMLKSRWIRASCLKNEERKDGRILDMIYETTNSHFLTFSQASLKP